MWEPIEQQVEQLIQQDLAKYNLKTLKETLQGLKHDTQECSAIEPGFAKIARLQAIISSCVINAPQFLAGNPATNFSCFWGFALLHLSLLKEQAHTVPNAASDQQLRDAAIAYSKYAQVALSRMYNRPMELNPNESTNEPGKVSNWVVDFAIRFTDTGEELYRINRLFRHNPTQRTPSLADELRPLTEDANTAIEKYYPGAARQKELADLAYASVLELMNQWPSDEATALNKLKDILESDDYSDFVKNYYPTRSIYNNPETDLPVQTTPSMPVVNFYSF